MLCSDSAAYPQRAPVLIDRITSGWAGIASVEDRRSCCEQLEQGNILLIKDSAFLVSAHDQALLTAIPPALVSNKNISFDPRTRGLDGLRLCPELNSIRQALARYSAAATQLLANLLAPYASSWKIGLSSFRPIEEAGRRLSGRYRNDRLHIDSFPLRPANGNRILRCFTNIHTSLPRVWLTSSPLDLRDKKLRAELVRFARPRSISPARIWRRCVELAGIVPPSSPYDRFMLSLHNRMKADADFLTAPPLRYEFAPGSTWLIFTDAVPHAVLEGRFALEQTFMIAREALLLPDKAPAALFERLCAPG